MPIRRALVIHPYDDVAVMLEDCSPGDEIVARLEQLQQRLIAKEAIPFGFKVALRLLRPGESVRKYGEVIGQASQEIAAGGLVHVHNLVGARGRGDLAAGGVDERTYIPGLPPV